VGFSSREEGQAGNFRKMRVAMARDLRVLMIKLADRLHNMRTLDYLPSDRAKKLAQETLDIYAPLAHRLGMAKVKAELEDLALRTLNPEHYVDLQKRVAKRRLEREADINQVIAILQRKLSEVGIESQIRGRPKHFYSIWKKMHDQGREFDEIYDLTAVRVITMSVRDCYGALGVIHSLWKPVPGRFKDFIAMPKVNRKLVPLRNPLRQGEIVEIITAPSQHPSRDWLKIVKSTRARSKINQWLKVEERARSIELGRELFEREAKKYRLNPTALLAGEEIKKAAADLGYATGDDLLAALGYGKSSVHQLLNKLAPGALLEPPERARTVTAAPRPKTDQGVRIRGVDDLL